MSEPILIGNATLYCGDCREALAEMADNSVDSVVCDPPYGLGNEPDINAVLDCWLSGNVYRPKGGGFMGKAWDAFVPGPEIWREVYRVLKPGWHLLAFAGTRTVDVMGIALRLAGFEQRNLFCWAFGSGFPKSLSVSRALDQIAGAEREVVGSKKVTRDMKDLRCGNWGNKEISSKGTEIPITVPETKLAKQWDGWGSALKPALEPILLCRKPLSEATIAANVVKHGTGGLNIDGCRVAIDESVDDPRLGGKGEWHIKREQSNHTVSLPPSTMSSSSLGRFPPNLLLDDSPEVAALFPNTNVSGDKRQQINPSHDGYCRPGKSMFTHKPDFAGYHDAGSASRFFPRLGYGPDDAPLFYCAKASASERDQGLEGMDAVDKYRKAGLWNSHDCFSGKSGDEIWKAKNPNLPKRNNHPTVKPVNLLRWMVRLITPPDGIVLDPFLGSGTTGIAAYREGLQFIGCEMEPEYFKIACRRIEAAQRQMSIEF